MLSPGIPQRRSISADMMTLELGALPSVLREHERAARALMLGGILGTLLALAAQVRRER